MSAKEKARPAEASNEELVIFNPRTAVSKLSPAMQKMLEKYEIREAGGFADQWKPKDPGDCIIGGILAIRDVETQFGPGTVVTMQTPAGQLAVWLGAELRVKLADAEKGQVWCIQYEGTVSKKTRPGMKGDMKTYTVFEIVRPSERSYLELPE